MSEVTFSRVLSCSSEDTGYGSSNLLKSNVSSGKWRCKVGEKNATVVLQLEHSVKIGQIDIGNNGSAFIEVLVGRSTNSVDDFSVILPSSSFMSPAECKTQSGGNLCRVRMFDHDKMIKTVCDEPWDLVKVVCTQPFNKSVPFGISFIKVYSASNSCKESHGSTSKNIQSEPVEERKIVTTKQKIEVQTMPSGSGEKLLEADHKQVGKRSLSPIDAKTVSCSPKRNKTESSFPTNPKRPLSGVVFVLSGFQNPERSTLRNKAVELGAKYEADWAPNCTHLVCAFANTPKFNQVKGKGKIVSKKWIEDCFNRKGLLDWRDYDMTGKGSSSQSSASNRRDNESGKAKTSVDVAELTGHLPNIFCDKCFYFHQSLDSTSKADLNRIIVTFGGSVTSKVSSATDFVVANDGSDVADLENDHPEVVIVKPNWLFACQRKHKFLPYDQFTLS